ncbi:dihydrolipoamide acetyltransferase family protein [Agromyces soli]|uniref:Dihydrolipoamide acetyltransferase component of pyruvate dehydrogenase complex n=1 Tax=Agromyces soli TaxID=659012 RepID=A0ABY4ARK8_9MICO|nr:dihydrolipoamide acetyltransferase family protein [Agromyces soli]UOE25439.1 2-oxo acid dehydrogenase subunit E2 [Agromyces soli]
MSREFLLPDLGEGLSEAEIVAWLVAPGDTVAVDQPVVELESAKSVVQLPCPFDGVVSRLGGEVGTVLHEGAVLLALEPSGDAAVEAAADAPETTDAAEETSGAVLVGYGTMSSTVATRPVGAPGRFGRRDAARAAGGPPSRPRLDPARRFPVVSPIVRRLARQNGFDASRLEGTGPDHLVLRRDVEAYLASGATTPDTPRPERSAQPEAARTAAVDGPSSERDERIPLDRMRRAAAAQFTRSRREIPEATVWLDVDATRLVEARRELREATGERFGLTALIARFAVAGLARHPILNSSFDSEREEIVQHRAVHLGVATQGPRGLVVPVIADAGALTLRGLRDAIAAVPDALGHGGARLRGGTFTLNNYGALGVDGSAAIINHPEAAMLGVGRFVERPWVVDGAIVPRTVTELTLSFDHRVCDGAEAAAFLTFVAGCIERPMTLLAEL